MHACTHTCTQPFYSSLHLSRTTRVSWYQKKHSPTHTYRGHQSSLICFIHLIRFMAFSLFNPHACQSFSTISVQVFFGLPIGLAPSTSYSIHFFTQSLSSFCNTCPYHHNLFCCNSSTAIMSSNPSLSLNPLLGILSCSFTPHIYLTTATHYLLLPQIQIGFTFLVLPFWCQLTQVVSDKIQEGHKTVVCVFVFLQIIRHECYTKLMYIKNQHAPSHFLAAALPVEFLRWQP